MGIRFLCASCGKKINVKAFLAGKRGVCPHCGASVEIPNESTLPSKSDQGAETPPSGQPSPVASSVPEGTGNAPGIPAATAATPLAAASAVQPASQAPAAPQVQPTAAPSSVPVATGPQVATVSAAAPAQPAATQAVPAGVPVGSHAAASGNVPMGTAVIQPTPTAVPQPAAPANQALGAPPSTAPASSDPINEAPDANWYVRPPSGGQYGPAKGDVMRQWIGEGRVTADSLVWRDGWGDWQTAGPLFAELGQQANMPAAPGQPTVPPTSPTSKSRASARRRKQGNSSLAIAIVVVLVLISIALVGVLVAVLSGNNQQETSQVRRDAHITRSMGWRPVVCYSNSSSRSPVST